MKQATVIFLVNNQTQEICLGMKKRGFGEGKWNGFGGKLANGEDIYAAAIRELEEETRKDETSEGVKIERENLLHVATLDFVFEHKPEWGQQVEAFLINSWQGEPVESEEMRPQWFKINEIPYELMWPDERIWLPRVLQGEKLVGEFRFGEGEELVGYDLKRSVS